ncbi:ArnT family glycosyltransferase [Desulfoluna spongiiphila]|uniref:ArnT family glycosyltransferase n=1 Tax=Desulfoluna spongiiphila TaxID=419481 RepID=UPI001254C723|nr:glycosyltransferase family 39 protein [Desulfoluna spongiiphila]VVS93216.1 glycosyltransferase rgta/b/c/d-like [Desulfoluna spongiiphila]
MLSRGLWAGLVVVVGFIALLCLVPPVSRDALVHHLAVPKLYLKAGGMVEIPTMEWAYYPMNLDVLYWASLALGSDILPKFIHFAFGLGTAALLYRYLRKALGGIWGLVGAFLFLTTPVIMKLSTTVYVDLGLAFFSLAATLSLFRCRENGFSGWKGVAWAGVLCGLGLGVKYNGLLVLLILAALVPLMVSRTVPAERHRDAKAIGFAALFVVAALLAYGPTGIRNTVWTGNPIYPLYNGTVQKVTKALTHPAPKAPVAAVSAPAAPAAKGHGRLHPLQLRRLIYDESSLDLALLPVRLFFQGQDGNSRLFDGRFSPLLFLFVPLLILWRRMPDAWRSDVGCLLFITWIYIGLAICLTSVRVRYLVPVVPHLVLLAVYGLKLSADTLRQTAQPLGRTVGTTCLALFVAYGLWVNTAYAANLYRYVNPLAYLSGEVDRDGYVARYRVEHDAFRYINRNLAPTDRLYFIYLGKRGYYCDIPYVPDSGGHLRGLLNRGTALCTPGEMAGYLKKKGITHLVVNMSLAWPHLTEDGRPGEAEGFDRFLRTRTRLLFQSRGVYVFALK